MTYNIREYKVRNNLHILESIDSRISRGEAVEFEVASVEEVSTLHYQMNELLKCAQVFPSYGYSHIRDDVIISAFHAERRVVVRPKSMKRGVMIRALSALQPDKEEIDKAVEELVQDLGLEDEQPDEHEPRESPGHEPRSGTWQDLLSGYSDPEDEPADELDE